MATCTAIADLSGFISENLTSFGAYDDRLLAAADSAGIETTRPSGGLISNSCVVWRTMNALADSLSLQPLLVTANRVVTRTKLARQRAGGRTATGQKTGAGISVKRW